MPKVNLSPFSRSQSTLAEISLNEPIQRVVEKEIRELRRRNPPNAIPFDISSRCVLSCPAIG